MLTYEQIKELVDKRFICKTKIGKGPRPDKVPHEVYGHHSSYVHDDYRIWGFESEAGRDRFIIDFNIGDY